MAAVHFFKEHFLSPMIDTWTELKNSSENSLTRVDISNYIWNSLICSFPLVAGGGIAHVANSFFHQRLNNNFSKSSPTKTLFSVLCTASSTILGITISFFVVKFLNANGGTLSTFTADKALKLETLHVMVLGTLTPLASYFEIQHIVGFNLFLSFMDAPAVAGYFGSRSLYVIGALSALHLAIRASAPKAKPSNSEDVSLIREFV